MLIYLVRHGQTQGNTEDKPCGHFETPLTDLGIKQAQSTGKELAGIQFDKIFSSDLSRAYDTALNIISSDQEIITSQLLRERNYGEFDGQPRALIDEARGKLGMGIWEFIQQHPSIESNEQMINRFTQFIDENIKNSNDETILITSHGGFIRAAISHIIGTVGPEITHLGPIHNASICIVEHTSEGKLKLITYNQHLHLLNLT